MRPSYEPEPLPEFDISTLEVTENLCDGNCDPDCKIIPEDDGIFIHGDESVVCDFQPAPLPIYEPEISVCDYQPEPLPSYEQSQCTLNEYTNIGGEHKNSY